MQTTELEQFAKNNSHRLLMKLEHYFSIYDRHFRRFRGKPVRILEIGVYKGGGLDMWRSYFGPEATITGIDIFDSARELASPGTDILICDQADTSKLESIFKQRPAYDIIIDDGGHAMNQQIGSFNALFPLLAPGGVYLVEDTHTSYWRQFGGGLRAKETFLEFAKQCADYVNADHFRDPDTLDMYPPLKDALRRELVSATFYDSICVFEKGNKSPKQVFHYYGDGDTRRVGISKEFYPQMN